MATFQKRNDRWRAIVRRKDCPAQSRTFPTKSAAKLWADRVERELADWVARGSPVQDTTPFGEIIDWYIERRDPRDRAEEADQSTTVSAKREKSSRPLSETDIGNLTRLKEGLGDVPAVSLSSEDIIRHFDRRRHGEHRDRTGQAFPPVSGATLSVELSCLRHVIGMARSLKQPCPSGDVIGEARPALRHFHLIAKSKQRHRRPTADELTRIRAHLRARKRAVIPMADIVDFALTTARRQSEITRLLWSEFDRERRLALVRDVKHPTKKEGNHKLFPVLGEATSIILRQPRIEGEDRIFPYKPESVSAAFTSACKALGIKDLRFHDLRHEATSRLFEQGYSIPEVAAVTLHETWTDLKRYTQIRPESLHRDAHPVTSPRQHPRDPMGAETTPAAAEAIEGA